VIRMDIVSVFHNQVNFSEHEALKLQIAEHHPEGGYRFVGVDNRINNRGFAVGCNRGALAAGLDSPIIGFINPDTWVGGSFIREVEKVVAQGVTITGCRYGKSEHELNLWGVRDWVCGASFFVTREFFTRVGGFDEQFVWGWEETDLIRQAQAAGNPVRSIDLPLRHSSPDMDTPQDIRYKNYHFAAGGKRFNQKWAR